jgi:hypothetical protein
VRGNLKVVEAQRGIGNGPVHTWGLWGQGGAGLVVEAGDCWTDHGWEAWDFGLWGVVLVPFGVTFFFVGGHKPGTTQLLFP